MLGIPFNELYTVTKVADYTAGATSDVTSSSVDMAGYVGVFFVGVYGTAASDNTPHGEQSSDDGAADAWADLESTAVGVGSSDEIVWLEINRPQERYVRTVWERGTSSTLFCVLAFQYGGRTLGEDNTVAGTIHGEAHVAPAEGTK